MTGPSRPRADRAAADSTRRLGYAAAKKLAASRRKSDRRAVGAHGGAPPEVLYYLASDTDPQVRAAVAANRATPTQADILLAHDRDDAVRSDLATKLASAISDEKVRQAALSVLEILVEDQAARVRQAISEALKDMADAPRPIVTRLARDREIEVARPVLECSPVLDEDDVLAILAAAPVPGALAAIARRRTITTDVADAIGTSGDTEAIAVLLANPSAQIREETLDLLVERAPGIPRWHRPMAERPGLPGRLVQKLATFVASHLFEVLRTRADLDPATARAVEETVMQRLAAEGEAEAEASVMSPAEALALAHRMKADGELQEEAVLKFAAGDGLLARAALAARAGFSLELIDRVIGSHSAKGITALAWKAGLSMRGAERLQMTLGRLPPSAVLKPRRDGSFPLPPEAMRWQLEFLTGIEGIA